MYDLNCHKCGDPFTSSRPQTLYCSGRCKRAQRYALYKAERNLPLHNASGPLLRLADVPAEIRIRAFKELVDSGQLTVDEIPAALAAVLEPGNLSALAA